VSVRQGGQDSGVASDAQRIRDAAARYGRSLDAVAAQYTNPLTGRRLSGEALILKTVQGESGGRRDAVSKAGARAWAQFMPATRAEVIRKYGVDPWRSPEEAVHALTLHMRGKLGNATGLQGYNPGGGQGYVDYILKQRVGGARGSTPRSSGGARAVAAPTSGGASTAGSTTTSGASTSSPISPFSPGALSTRLASVQLEQSPGISTAGPALPAGLRPRYYMEVPSSGPPLPPPDPSLPDAAGQEVSFGDPQALPVPAGAPAASSAGAPSGGSAGTGRPGPVVRGFKPGRPVASGTSTGGVHQTDGLPGFPARDYFAPAGSAAVAPVSGTVIRLSGHDPKNGPTQGPHGPLGWSVYIKGSDGKTYFLTHMGSRSVKVGDRLKAGQKIGTVADYHKYGTPDHIHMGVHG
jgi:murein DD-endopeptidase MepM/ murein hydrolase activator NlpD